MKTDINVQQIVAYALSFFHEVEIDKKTEFFCFKRVKKKTFRDQKMKRLRVRKRVNWIFVVELSMRDSQIFVITIFEKNVELFKQFRKKQYFEIIKSKMYKINFVMKLNNFVCDCQNVFDVRSAMYRKHRAKIVFAIFLFNQIFEFNWIWIRYCTNFNAILKSFFTWTEFCVFFKKHVNFAKLKIVNIEKKLHNLKQRSSQTISQLISYLKTLEWQWFEFIQNIVRTNYFTQTLHKYIRKKLKKHDINMNNRKTIKKIVMIIENKKKSFFILEKTKKNNKI